MIYNHWFFDRLTEYSAVNLYESRERNISYEDLKVDVDEEVNFFLENGLNYRRIICISGDFCYEVLVAILAALKCGAIVVPLVEDSVVELDAVIDIATPELLYTPKIKKIRALAVYERPELLVDFLGREEPGFILFSSGTSGEPKGMLLSFPKMIQRFFKKRKLGKSIPLLMIDHFGGINTVFGIMNSGATIVQPENTTIGGVCAAIQDFKVETLPTTPSFLNLLIVSSIHDQFDLSSLKRITYGTEVMPQSTLDKLRALFPDVIIQQTYGLSEVGVLGSKSRDDNSLWVRIGGDGFETRVIDGVLWIRSKYGIEGYLNSDEPYNKDGWFNTQDNVEVDGDWFKILGRDSDVIIVGGQKVYPAEIENVLLQHPMVQDCVVYGKKDNLLSNSIHCDVVLNAGQDDKNIKSQLRKYCRSKIAIFKIPVSFNCCETVTTKRSKKNRNRGST